MENLSTKTGQVSKNILNLSILNNSPLNSSENTDSLKVNNRISIVVADFHSKDLTKNYHPLLFYTNRKDSLDKKSIIGSPKGVMEHGEGDVIYGTFWTIPNHASNIDDEGKKCHDEYNSEPSLIKKINACDMSSKQDSNKTGFEEGKVSRNLFHSCSYNKKTLTPVGERTINDCNQNNHYATSSNVPQSITEQNNILQQRNKNIKIQGMTLASAWKNKEHKTVANQALKNYFEIKKKNMEEEERTSVDSNSKSSSEPTPKFEIWTKPVDKSEVRELIQDEEQKGTDSHPQIVKQEPRDTSGTEFNFRASSFTMGEEQDRWNVSLAGNNVKLQSPLLTSLNNKQDDTIPSSTPYFSKTNNPFENTNQSVILESRDSSEFRRKPLAEELLWSHEEQKQQEQIIQKSNPGFDQDLKIWEDKQQPQRPLEDVMLFGYDDQWQMQHPQVPSTIEANRGAIYTIHQDPHQPVYQQGYSLTAPQTIQEYQPYQHYIVSTSGPPSQQHFMQSTSAPASKTFSPIKTLRRTISPSPHNLSRAAAPASQSSPRGRYSAYTTYASVSSGAGATQHHRGTSPSRFYHSQQHITAGSNSRSTTPHRRFSGSRPTTPPTSTIQGSNPSTPPNTAISSSSNRSAPDILKTLLRKKACLYEPDTSQAIALITWLVGRHLALSHGYFSRQQLQAGVHHVVQNNITSGVITRTKVNRCMQIILNCCFHYIIPRPDGVEDSGDVFRKKFQSCAVDDSYKILNLPYPWNDIDVNALLQSWDSNITPTNEDTGQPVKRTVLLCFNENVKSSDDVFQCHKDFIRDAANSANLHLTANEWKQFFFGDSSITSHVAAHQQDAGSCASSTTTTTTAPYSPSTSIITTSPLHTGSCASTSSPLSLPISSWQQPTSPIAKEQSSTSVATSDYFGRMTYKELNDFRTSWCAKRYDHDTSLCGFAHTESNRGWLRRNPSLFTYEDKLCNNIISINAPTTSNTASSKDEYYFNACPFGKLCSCAHSQEEIDYHPNRYKTSICPSAGTPQASSASRASWKASNSKNLKSCQLRDICPNYHPYRQSQQHLHHHHYQEGRQHQQSHSRYAHHNYYHHHQHHHRYGDYHSTSSPQQRHHNHQAISKPLPIAPMMYILPSPVSDFEKSLTLPGLCTLFRQRSSTMYSVISNRNDSTQQKQSVVPYTLFGNVSETNTFSFT